MEEIKYVEFSCTKNELSVDFFPLTLPYTVYKKTHNIHEWTKRNTHTK